MQVCAHARPPQVSRRRALGRKQPQRTMAAQSGGEAPADEKPSLLLDLPDALLLEVLCQLALPELLSVSAASVRLRTLALQLRSTAVVPGPTPGAHTRALPPCGPAAPDEAPQQLLQPGADATLQGTVACRHGAHAWRRWPAPWTAAGARGSSSPRGTACASRPPRPGAAATATAHTRTRQVAATPQQAAATATPLPPPTGASTFRPFACRVRGAWVDPRAHAAPLRPRSALQWLTVTAVVAVPLRPACHLPTDAAAASDTFALVTDGYRLQLLDDALREVMAHIPPRFQASPQRAYHTQLHPVRHRRTHPHWDIPPPLQLCRKTPWRGAQERLQRGRPPSLNHLLCRCRRPYPWAASPTSPRCACCCSSPRYTARRTCSSGSAGRSSTDPPRRPPATARGRRRRWRARRRCAPQRCLTWRAGACCRWAGAWRAGGGPPNSRRRPGLARAGPPHRPQPRRIPQHSCRRWGRRPRL